MSFPRTLRSLRQPLIWLIAAVCAGLAIASLPVPELALACLLLLGLITVALAVCEPLIGLCFTLLIAPFAPLENIMLRLPLDSGQIMLGITFAAWGLRGLYERRLDLSGARSTIAVGLLVFVAVAGLSFFVATSFELWARETLKWVEVLLVCLIVSSEQDRRKVGLVVVAILVSGMFQAGLGVYQFALRGEGPDEFAILGGRFYRAYGTFEQPNPFGGYMGLIWPFALGIGLYGAYSLWRKPRNTLDTATSISPIVCGAAVIVAGLALTALVLSWSRGAWLGAAAAGIAVLAVALRRPALSLSALIVVAGLAFALNAAGLLPQSVRARLTDFTQQFASFDVRGVNVNDANYSVIERLAHWQAAQNMIVEHPWLGVGFGNYPAVYDRYRAMKWPNALGHAHNYYLNLWAETGLLGLAAYAGLWGVVIVRTLQLALAATRSSFAAWLGVGLIGAWAHLSVHHLVDNLYVANTFILIGAYLGLLNSAFARRPDIGVVASVTAGLDQGAQKFSTRFGGHRHRF
ncbi:MAG: O-antigen ligase family protein [Anaerolineae bacterium]|nr:O-antigen ligase family protein [Thermoflexales bacterium]MDW8408064.1 O-antigen ligase family protein [Anaerolineae bacterium]